MRLLPRSRPNPGVCDGGVKIADPPTAAHFDVKWNSGIAFGSDTGGALEIVHTDNSGTYSLAINRNAELQIVFGTLPGANSITLQLAAIIDLLGSSVSPSIAGAINMVPREIPICVGGVAKKVIVLASQDY